MVFHHRQRLCAIADIAKANNIQLTTRLKVGDRLVIPSSAG
jgi:LysM domain